MVAYVQDAARRTRHHRGQSEGAVVEGQFRALPVAACPSEGAWCKHACRGEVHGIGADVPTVERKLEHKVAVAVPTDLPVCIGVLIESNVGLGAPIYTPASQPTAPAHCLLAQYTYAGTRPTARMSTRAADVRCKLEFDPCINAQDVSVQGGGPVDTGVHGGGSGGGGGSRGVHVCVRVCVCM